MPQLSLPYLIERDEEEEEDEECTSTSEGASDEDASEEDVPPQHTPLLQQLSESLIRPVQPESGVVTTRFQTISSIFTSEDSAVAMDPVHSSIEPGRFLRFKNPEIEYRYLQAKYTESKGALVFTWAVMTPLCLADMVMSHVVHFDQRCSNWFLFEKDCLGLSVLFSAQLLALFIAQVPLIVRVSVDRVEVAESVLLAFAILCFFLVAFPMNKWRCGYIFHQNGKFLFEMQHHWHETKSSPSDTLFVSIFFLLSSLYLSFGFIRAHRVCYYLLATFLIFVTFSGLIPGTSPEQTPDVLMYTIFMLVYLIVLWRTKLRSELMDRRNFERMRLLGEEAAELREAHLARIKLDWNSEQRHRVDAAKAEFEHAIEQEDKEGILAVKRNLSSLLAEDASMSATDLDQLEKDILRRQSEDRGVRLSYLLSDEFQQLAQRASGKNDPSFYELQAPFFMGPDAIGRERICPRDGRRGCAFVDALPVHHRGKCTHFLSWTWAYRLSTVRRTLQRWAELNGHEPSEVCFFMCFFVNNQYRILAPPDQGVVKRKGSDKLEETFENNLLRVGKMVALLDTYDKPKYLTRIWTIFEQFTALRLRLQVEIVMPKKSRDALIQEFERGKDGIMKVRDSMVTVDSSSARATDQADEDKVKRMITQSVGFKRVDEAIKCVMTAWVARELRSHMDEIMQVAEDEQEVCESMLEPQDGTGRLRRLRHALGFDVPPSHLPSRAATGDIYGNRSRSEIGEDVDDSPVLHTRSLSPRRLRAFVQQARQACENG